MAGLKCAVVLVSFGVSEGAALWLKETKTAFPMYLDQDRKIYKALNMPRSVAMVSFVSRCKRFVVTSCAIHFIVMHTSS